jgi:subfamily B ATP-binding cassette protein MsbA
MRYVAPHWEVLVLALGSLVAMASTVPMLVALIQPVLDSVVAEKNLELMQVIVLAIIGLFAVRSVAGHIGAYAINWVGSRMAMDLRMDMFNKLLMLPASYYAARPNAAVFSVITSGATRVAEAFTALVTVLVKDTFTIIGLLVWMFYLDWTLALVALSMSSAIWVIMRLTGKRLRGTAREVGRTTDGLSHVLEESIENYQVVKLYGAEGYEIERMRKQAERLHRDTTKRTAMVSLGVPLAQMSIAFVMGLIIYVAAQHAFADKITVGGFASLAAGMVMLMEPIRRIAGVNESLQNSLSAADSVFSLLDHEIESDKGTTAIERARGELKFIQVSFCPDSKIGFDAISKLGPDAGLKTRAPLRDVTLTLKPGELVALVDSSGAKATLINLVPRFLDPTSGQILLDGHDVRSLTLASLRANISLVSAGITEFNDTIAENIAFGAMNRATEGNITSAAQAAHASEFIRRMPQGLQTMVGEQGQKLSSDQRLRIAIARALLKDPPILLLDEKFDTVDSESAHQVDAALETLTRGRTTLVIEPRLSTLRRADSVVLFEEGRIVDTGRHVELLARNRPYAKFSQTLLKPEKVVALSHRRTYPEAD